MIQKVSIIIPFVKDRGYLQEAIDSVKKQTYKNIELILSQSDKRVGFNINRGIEKATGDFIKYLCDDDLLTENSISDSVQGIGESDFLHGNAINFYENGDKILQRPRIKNPTLKQMNKVNQIHGGTLFYRKDVFERFGLFDESLTTGEEYDFNLMLLSKGAKLEYIDKTLYKYRRHKEQKSIGTMNSEHQQKRQITINQIRTRYV